MASDKERRSLVRLDDIQAALKSSDSELRLRAVRDLVALRNPELISFLRDAQTQEADVQIRYEMRKGISILQAMDENSSKEESGSGKGFSSNLKRVEESLQSEDLEQVNKAFRYIVQYRLKQFLPLMQSASRRHDSPYQRSLIVRFMQSAGGEGYFNEIVTYLADPDPRVVSTAIEALESIGNTKALAYLTQCVTHEHNRVQASAMKALYNLGDENALSLFEKLVQSPHSEYRNSAAYALKEMQIEKGIPLLGVLLHDSYESVREKALEGLNRLAEKGSSDAKALLEGQSPLSQPPDGQIPYPSESPLAERLDWIRACQKEPDTLSSLLAAVEQESDAKGLASIVMALGHTRNSEASKALVPFLKHSDDRVRANAVEALGMVLPTAQLWDTLGPMLDDFHNRVVGNSILALHQDHQAEASRALRFLAESSSRNEQLTAVFCIGALATEDCIQLSEALTESHHTEVRDKMLQTLETLSQESSFAQKVLRQNRLRMAAFQPASPESKEEPEEPKTRPTEKPQAPVQPKMNPAQSRKKPKVVVQEVSWEPMGTVLMAIPSILMATVLLTRMFIQDESTYQAVLYFFKAPLLFEWSQLLFWVFLLPLSFGVGLYLNARKVFELPYFMAVAVGLFAMIFIPTPGFLKLSFSQYLNFTGYYSASIWVDDPYSMSFHLARLLFNGHWLLLTVGIEAFLRSEETVQKAFSVALTSFGIFLSVWLGVLNHQAWQRMAVEQYVQQRSWMQQRIEDLQKLHDLARYRKLQMQDRLQKAELEAARELSRLKIKEIEKEQSNLQEKLESTQAQLRRLEADSAHLQ